MERPSWLHIEPRFPAPETADEHGLVLVGGRLLPRWVLAAYRQGIFPWPFEYNRRMVLAWFSPDPRAILEFTNFHVSHRLRRRLNSGQFEVSFDRDFAGVIRACAQPRDLEGGTWLTPQMIDTYIALHQQGHAHSVETWSAGHLVGGVYGVAIGGFFAAESMFHRQTDASKVALFHLVTRLAQKGFSLLDIQQATPHSLSLGATEIPRAEFLLRLKTAMAAPAQPFVA